LEQAVSIANKTVMRATVIWEVRFIGY
jgi:hypothetical protein